MQANRGKQGQYKPMQEGSRVELGILLPSPIGFDQNRIPRVWRIISVILRHWHAFRTRLADLFRQVHASLLRSSTAKCHWQVCAPLLISSFPFPLLCTGSLFQTPSVAPEPWLWCSSNKTSPSYEHWDEGDRRTAQEWSMEVVDCCRKLLLEEVTGRWLCLNCGERRPGWGEWRGAGKMFGVGSACWRAWWDRASRGRKQLRKVGLYEMRRLYGGGRHSLTSRDWEKGCNKRYWGSSMIHVARRLSPSKSNSGNATTVCEGGG